MIPPSDRRAAKTSVPRPVKTWRPAAPVERLDLVLLGDTSFGENYQEERASRGHSNVLEERGYDHGFEHVHGLLQQADLVVANLETPLTTLRTSPFEDIRTWLHYGDPELTPRHLLAHNIRAVTLANNHTHDYGVEGLLDTFAALEANGIMAVGAGRDLDDARQPLRIEAELAIPTRRRRPKQFGLSLFSAFRGGRQFREELKAYADTDRPGSASLALNALSGRIRQIRGQRPEELIVVMPHWRRDYKWRSNAQAEAAERLTGAGADLVIGHGSHMLQEIELVNGRWVVNGIGNFLFNSPGRYQSLGAPPYSLMARLTMTHAEGTLRLYPIVTDNRRTGCQPRPVNDTEFAEVHTLLADKTNAPDHFRHEFEPAEDEHGWHLAVHLDRDTSRKKGRSSRHRSADAPPIRVATDPTSADPLGFDRRRDTSTQLIAHELEQRDIQVQWLTRNFIVADANGVRLGYLATDSHATGAASVRAARRKDLTRHLLADAGLAIARGGVFDHHGGQAEAARLAQSLDGVVVKPVDGNMGRGVTVGANGPQEFERAWHAAAAITRRGVLVEEQFIGTEGRFVVVGERCVAAIKRIAPYVIGNGKDTVEQLIQLKNQDRAKNPNLHKRLIEIDPHRIDVLREQGYELTHVPPEGTRLTLDLKANISTGGESVDITDDVHPSFLDVAVRAAAAFPGLDVAGVDLIVHDFGREADPGNYIVCEVNNRPGIGSHHFPIHGDARNVAGAIVDLHLGALDRSAAKQAPTQGYQPPRPDQAEPGDHDPNTHLIALELTRRDIPVRWLSRDFLVADLDGRQLAYWGARSHRTGRAGVKAATQPDLARRLLASAGFEIAPEVEQFAGTEARFLVVGGQCAAVVTHVPSRGAVDLMDQVHPSFTEMAARVVAVFPGLDVAEVTIVARDVEAQAEPGNHVISAVSAKPELAPYQRPADGQSRDVAAAIVELHLRDA